MSTARADRRLADRRLAAWQSFITVRIGSHVISFPTTSQYSTIKKAMPRPKAPFRIVSPWAAVKLLDRKPQRSNLNAVRRCFFGLIGFGIMQMFFLMTHTITLRQSFIGLMVDCIAWITGVWCLMNIIHFLRWRKVVAHES